MAERLNLLAWAMLIIGFLVKIHWLLFLGLVFLLLFAIIRRIYLPFPSTLFQVVSFISFFCLAVALIFHLINPSQDKLYLGIALWLIVALFDLLVEVYYGK